jgi:hypothetical protein
VIGPQLLTAIHNLTNLLETQANAQKQQRLQPAQDAFSPLEIQSIGSAFSPSDTGQDIHSRHIEQGRDRRYQHGDEQYDASRAAHSSVGRENDQKTLSHEGLESVLKWNIFSSRRTFQILSVDNEPHTPPHIHTLPSIEYSELVRLEKRYIEAVHTKNPILDLHKLHQMIGQVAENGLDWSTGTCLVALVCAIGASSQQYVGPHRDDAQDSSNAENERRNADLQLADQFWSVAAKRLGFAIGQNNLEAVQCLCLTGYALSLLFLWITSSIFKSIGLQEREWQSTNISVVEYGTCFNSSHCKHGNTSVWQAMHGTPQHLRGRQKVLKTPYARNCRLIKYCIQKA